MERSELRGKVVAITGASSGIGRACALAFAGIGTHLALGARRGEALQQVADEARLLGVQAIAIPTDVAETEQVDGLVQQALAQFGQIDILVANAGMYWRCPACELRWEDIERVMAVNYYGCLRSVLAVLPHMRKRGSGHIVAVSSVDGKKGIPPDAAYVASKFAVTGFMEVLRQEMRGTGVHVSTIFPGRIDTPMLAGVSVPWITPKVPAEKVAEAIVGAVLGNKAEVLVPYAGAKLLLVLNSFSAGLGDLAVRALRLSGKGI